jgi:hypothetical protein
MGGSRRMGSDDDFQIRQVLLVGARFCCWARWALFFIVHKCIIVNKNVYYSRYNVFT